VKKTATNYTNFHDEFVIICGICGKKIMPQIKGLEKIKIKSAKSVESA